MAKTRVIRKDLSEDEAKYLVEFSPPLRVSSLRRFPQLKLHPEVDPDDTPMKYAWIMTDAKSLSLFGTDKYGSNDQEPWYDQSSVTSTSWKLLRSADRAAENRAAPPLYPTSRARGAPRIERPPWPLDTSCFSSLLRCRRA